MKRFTFELEAVRGLRMQEELDVQQELAGVLAELTQLDSQLSWASKAEQDLYEHVRSARMSAMQMQNYANFAEHARQRIVDARVAVFHKEQEIARVRARLVEAQAKRKALDKLESRQRDAHRTAELAEEQRQLDEISTMRHGRDDTLITSTPGAGMHGTGVAA